MRVIVRPLNISEISLCYQAPGYDGSSTNDLLNSIAPEIKRILIDVDTNAVDPDLLADVARNDVRVITVLPQVIILLFGGCVCEV